MPSGMNLECVVVKGMSWVGQCVEHEQDPGMLRFEPGARGKGLASALRAASQSRQRTMTCPVITFRLTRAIEMTDIKPRLRLSAGTLDTIRSSVGCHMRHTKSCSTGVVGTSVDPRPTACIGMFPEIKLDQKGVNQIETADRLALQELGEDSSSSVVMPMADY